MASAEPASDAVAEAAFYKSVVEDLRGSLTCKICLKFLYEPFTTSCGHTFCYECLNQWFKDHSNSKTCPVCRSRVRQQPAQAFAIREMVQTLCKDGRLLPPGERTEEHKLLREEMTFLMESHRKAGGSKGGLFEGSFRYEERNFAIFDEADDVWRCPACTAELDEGFCNSCGDAYDADGRPLDRPPSEEGSDLYVSEYSSNADHLDTDGFHEIEADVLESPPIMGSSRPRSMSAFRTATLQMLMSSLEPGGQLYNAAMNSIAPQENEMSPGIPSVASYGSQRLSDVDVDDDEEEEEEEEEDEGTEDDGLDDGSSVQSNISGLIDDEELESSDDDTSGQYESPPGYDVDAGTEAGSPSNSEDGFEQAGSEISDFASPAGPGSSLHPSVEFPPPAEDEGGYSWTSESEAHLSDDDDGDRPHGRGENSNMPAIHDLDGDEDDIQTALTTRKGRKRARVVISDDDDDEEDDAEPIVRPPKRPRAEVEDEDNVDEEVEGEEEAKEEAEEEGEGEEAEDEEEDTDEDEPVAPASRNVRSVARSLFGASRAATRLSISSEESEGSEEEGEKYDNVNDTNGSDTNPHEEDEEEDEGEDEDGEEESREDEEMEEEEDDPNLGPRARARRERLRNAITKATGVRPSARTGLTTASWAGGVRA